MSVSACVHCLYHHHMPRELVDINSRIVGEKIIGPKEYIQQATGSLPDFVRLLWLHVKYIFGNF